MKKIIMAILIFLVFTPTIIVHAEDATREVRVYLYRDYTDCVFLVSWENVEKSATIQVKDTDGKVVDANAQNAEFGKGRASISVGTAKSGYWTVYVTGESLGTINVSGGSKNSATVQYNAIQSFDAEVSGGYINFKWNVIAEQDTIKVAINVTQGEKYGEDTLWNDYYASKSGATSVSVDELLTGLYSFTIQVYDGKGQYTLSTDKPLYLKHSNSPAKLEGIKAGSIDGEMFTTWDTRVNSSFIVTLYDYDTLAVIKRERVDSNYYPIDLSDELDKIKLSVASYDGSTYGEFDVFEIIRSTPVGIITFPDYSSTRESSIAVKVDCPSEVTAGIYLDGILLLDNASAGNYDLNLSEGIHEVVAFVEDRNGNMKTFSKTITVDKTPPVVKMNNADSIKTASNTIVVDGNTEPNAVVAINGVEQMLDTGSFMAKLALKNGVNPITIVAYDLAGNKSIKTITANRTNTFDGSWTVYIAPGALFLVLTAWYIFLNKKPKEAQPNEKAD